MCCLAILKNLYNYITILYNYTIQTMTHVMIDIETLGVSPGVVISTIGAIKFDPRSTVMDIEKMDGFYARVDHDSCKEKGLIADPNTIEWWKTQDLSICEEIWSTKNRVSLATALKRLSKWYKSSDVEYIWAQGSHFDIPILEYAYTVCNLTPPWKFWQVRDSRTLFDFTDVKRPDIHKDMKHHSLYDSYRQLIGVQRAYSKLA